MTLVRKAKSARRILVAACGTVLATAISASADTKTWFGGGADDNWSNAANWLTGVAPLSNDALIFDGVNRLTPNNDLAAGTSITGINFAATASGFTLGGNAITLGGDLTSDSSGSTQTVNFGLALDANRTVRASDSAIVLNGVISGAGFGITKTGTGALTLGGVNTYTGPTVIDGGTLVYTADNTVSALNFGFTPAAGSASTNSSTLDLTSANLTASSLTVQTNLSIANVISIGTGKTLTVNGGFTVGPSETYTNTASGSITNLNVNGDSLVVNGGAGHFIANPGRSNTPGDTDPRVTVDMSNLTHFTYTGTTGEFRVGAGNGRATMTLASSSNNITAAQIRIGDSKATSSGDNNGGAGPRSTVHMGGGTNVLNANTIIIGEGKMAGALDFLSLGGTVSIAGETGGASTANITVGSSISGTGTNDESQLLLAGHDVTVQAGNVVIGRFAGATGGNSARGNVTFDTGTFSANSIQLGVNSSGNPTTQQTSVTRGILTLGGPFAGSGATGVLNVANTFYLANHTNSNVLAGPSEGQFIINGGTANINTDILDASTTVSGAGSNVTTLTLNGGTLNMSGHNIGTYTAPITTLNLNSGTLNGAARIAGTTINVNPAATISAAPTFVLPNAGTLVSGAPVLTLNNGGGLEGGGSTSGSIFGDVLADTGSHIAPGSATVAGTLQFVNALTLNNGSTVKFKLSANTSSDLIAANVLNLSGKINLDIAPLGLGPQSGNVYTLFTYSGSLTGDQTNFAFLPNSTRSTYTIVPTASTPGAIQISVLGGGPLSLTWVGNNGDNWDTNQTVNWKDGANVPQKFFSNDQVTFDNSSTNLNPVQIAGQVSPGSVLITGGRDYKFVGAGGISGTGNLTLTQAGVVTLATNNSYAGSTDINGGTLRIGDGGTTGTTGTGTINVNTGSLVFNHSNALTVSNPISGSGDLTQLGTGTLTLGGANTYSGGTTVNFGALRLSSASAAGTGGIDLKQNTILVSSASISNPLTLRGATVGTSATPVTFSGDVNLVPETTSTFRVGDPQNLPIVTTDANETIITGTLTGSGDMTVLSNGQDNNVDGGNGFRLRGATASTYSGTIRAGNNVKFELQTGQSGPFSPAGNGKIIMAAGDATLAGTLTTVTKTGGYSEIILRNNSGGDTTFGNDLSVTGSGLVVLNSTGSAPAGTRTTMGKLTAGAGQEVAVYLSANPTHLIEFTSVSLNGTATFSPKKAGFGADSSVGSDLSLANITETTPSGLNMNGLRTLFLPTGNIYSGPTQVNSGTLRVTNTTGSATGSGAVTVAGGATLTGTGIIGGTVSANANSHIVPGTGGLGTLTLGGLALAGSSNLDFEGFGNAFDLINVTNNNGLTFSGNATLNMTELSGLAEGDYTLIDYAGSPVGSLNGKLSLSNNIFAGGTLQGSLIDDAASTSIKLHVGPFIQGPPQWNVDTDGSWTVGSNWNPATVPDGASNGATFLGVITAARTVTLDGDRTMGTLAFDNANKYTIAQGSGGTLTIGNDANPGRFPSPAVAMKSPRQ